MSDTNRFVAKKGLLLKPYDGISKDQILKVNSDGHVITGATIADFSNSAHTHNDIYYIKNEIYNTGETYTKNEINGIFSSATLSGLTDTSINSVNDGDVLIYSGGRWINKNELLLTSLSGNGLINSEITDNGEFVVGNQLRNSSTINSTNMIDFFGKDLSDSCVWEYSVRNDTSIRTGVIFCCWVNTFVEYNSTSTLDIGDTTDINFIVNMDAGFTYIRLYAMCSTTWNIKYIRRII